DHTVLPAARDDLPTRDINRFIRVSVESEPMDILERGRPPFRHRHHPLLQCLSQWHHVAAKSRQPASTLLPDRNDLEILERPGTVIVDIYRFISKLGGGRK